MLYGNAIQNGSQVIDIGVRGTAYGLPADAARFVDDERPVYWAVVETSVFFKYAPIAASTK